MRRVVDHRTIITVARKWQCCVVFRFLTISHRVVNFPYLLPTQPSNNPMYYGCRAHLEFHLLGS